MAIWDILRVFGAIYGNLVYFPRFGKLYQEKSGNPDACSRQGRRKRVNSSFLPVKLL
jgi:hypothetical protein